MKNETVKQDSALSSIFSMFGGNEDDKAISLEKVNVNIHEDMSVVNDIANDYYSSNIAALALILANNDDIVNYNKIYVKRVIERINEIIQEQVNSILLHPEFRYLENQWLKLHELMNHDYDNIDVAVLDARTYPC